MLEDLELIDATKTALAFVNAAGDPGRPIVARRLRLVADGRGTTEVGVRFIGEVDLTRPAAPVLRKNENVEVADCRFEGPFKSAVQVEGSAAGLAVRGARVWQAVDGVTTTPPRPESAVEVTVENCTFAEAEGGRAAPGRLHADDEPGDAITLASNFFAGVPKLAVVDGGLPGFPLVAAKGNVRRKGSDEGNVPLGAVEADTAVGTDPKDDRHFLATTRRVQWRRWGPGAGRPGPGRRSDAAPRRLHGRFARTQARDARNIMTAPRLIVVLTWALAAGPATADDKPAAKAERFTYRVVGLFAPDRETVLREVIEEMPDLTLVGIAFDDAEMTVEFVPAKAFPGNKPEQLAASLDSKVRAATHHTIGVKPRRTVPRDKLRRVEIFVAGLDCKACCLAAYEAVAGIDGVEQATASFKDGLVTALIDPAKTDKAKLEDALRKREIRVGRPWWDVRGKQ